MRWVRIDQAMTIVWVMNRSVMSIEPELDEGMAMRIHGSSPVVSGKEKEPKERHAPEEIAPER